MMENVSLKDLEAWFNLRTHRERITLLILGFACIYLLYYILFSRPVTIEIANIKNETAVIKSQINTLQQAATTIIQNANKKQEVLGVEKATLSKTVLAPTSYEVMQNSSQLVQEIFKNQKTLQISSLKNLPVAIGSSGKMAEGFEITLKGDYFTTLAYLHNLEKLPWCLAWDSLQYTVTIYPEASIVIALHVLNA